MRRGVCLERTDLSIFLAYLLNSLKEQNLDPNLQNQYLSLYSQYLQQQPNAYAQIVSNVGGASDNSQSDISKVPIIYSQVFSHFCAVVNDKSFFRRRVRNLS